MLVQKDKIAGEGLLGCIWIPFTPCLNAIARVPICALAYDMVLVAMLQNLTGNGCRWCTAA